MTRHFEFPQTPAAAVGAAEPAGVAVPLNPSENAFKAPATTDDEGVAEGTALTAVAVPLIAEMTGGWMFIEVGGTPAEDACEVRMRGTADDTAEA